MSGRVRRWAAIAMLAGAAPAAAGSFPATVARAEHVNLSVPVSGVVAAVTARVGDRVRRGDELLRLEATPFEARAKRAKARLTQAQARYAEQERALKRAQELYDRGALSTVELDHAKLAHVEAASALQEADAALEIARYELDKSRLIAPFDAFVVVRDVHPGEIVSSALAPRTLVTVAPLGVYAARGLVARPTLAALPRGQAVTVRIGEHDFSGQVHSVGGAPQSGDTEPRYPVEIRFRTTANLVHPGDAAIVEWP